MTKILLKGRWHFYPPPKYACNNVAYKIVTRPHLDWIIFFVIMIDIGLTSTEVAISDLEVIEVLRILNFAVVSIYMTEVTLKVCASMFMRSVFCCFVSVQCVPCNCVVSTQCGRSHVHHMMCTLYINAHAPCVMW